MSMNLIFEIKSAMGNYIDYPYQTTTKFTYAMMSEPDREQRLTMAIKDIEDNIDEDFHEEFIREVTNNLKSENLELSYM